MLKKVTPLSVQIALLFAEPPKTKIENHLVFNRNFSSPSHHVGVKLTAFYLRFGDTKLIKKIKLENGDFQYLHPDQQLVCGHHKKINNLLVNTRLAAPAG